MPSYKKDGVYEKIHFKLKKNYMPSGWDNYKKIVCLETQQNLMGSCSNCLYCFSLLILLFSPNVKVFINAIETEYSKYGVCKKKHFLFKKKHIMFPLGLEYY